MTHPRETPAEPRDAAEPENGLSRQDLEDVVERVLSRARAREQAAGQDTAPEDDSTAPGRFSGRARELADAEDGHTVHDGDQQDLEERRALRSWRYSSSVTSSSSVDSPATRRSA